MTRADGERLVREAKRAGELAAKIASFDRLSNVSEHTDTGRAWELLNAAAALLRDIAGPTEGERPESLPQARALVLAEWVAVVGRQDLENAVCGDAVCTEGPKHGIDAPDAVAAVVCWRCEESIQLGGAGDCSDLLGSFLREHRHCTHPEQYHAETPGLGA